MSKKFIKDLILKYRSVIASKSNRAKKGNRTFIRLALLDIDVLSDGGIVILKKYFKDANLNSNFALKLSEHFDLKEGRYSVFIDRDLKKGDITKSTTIKVTQRY